MKKISFLLGLIALLAILASCTPAGAEIGLVGEWESKSGATTLKIGNDDSISETVAGVTTSGKITAGDATANTLTIEWDNLKNKSITKYSLSLDGKVLTFGGVTYDKK